ncbi:CAF17-like 4Fe-4S cluster assembly/insertion protein YgfZ [Rhizobium sp. G187]|uniref:CAF17-like 4Fe-4S cluster assembly/insertion protein YgfZ n=1 Tax=Rhizobium sp. G187 TaxID=3451352 RepID=UPI003EE5A664
MPSAFLPDRTFLRIGGPDAEHFLQNLITTDLGQVPAGEAWPGALLTPQGKILFDFLVWRGEDHLILETTIDQADALVRRLTMYKLRAAVTIEILEAKGTTVHFGEATTAGIVDHRFAVAGVSVHRNMGPTDPVEDQAAFDALRIACGIPESGSDFALQDAFPHDVLFDKIGGVSFRKGCYVGQEVVSRMQHRSTARRRLVIVTSDTALPSGSVEMTVGQKSIGTLGSVYENKGLAILRIDKAGEAMAQGQTILAGSVPVTLTLPQWSGLDFPVASEEG